VTRTPIDPYATLGVAREATPAQIAHAYRRLAKELHPDLGGDARGDRMREVNAAREILSDPGKRAAWDRGQSVVAAGAHWTPAAAGVRPVSTGSSAEWTPEPRPRRYAAYPRRPRPGERRLTDSPWLVAAIFPVIAAFILLVAGVADWLNPEQRSIAQDFEGFQQLERPPTLNRAVAGTAVEVRFSFYGLQGSDAFAAESPSSKAVTCGSGEGEGPDIRPASSAAGSSLSYRLPEHAWVYVWKTDASWAGSCRELTFTFRDGSSRSVLFDFRGPLR
jgi:curved DNA-binding protein CbpA